MCLRHTILLEADAFIVTPGGDGTLAESFFAHNRNLSALYSERTQKPIIFLNTSNYYKHLKEHFSHMADIGYSNQERQAQLTFEENPKAIISKLFPS
ncbi:MAG: LOG family protein [Alphaproteobacteria bacterium]|nr:LOG family protein [Alphaproteobacteria bacterium]